MFCPKCGVRNLGDAKFCRSCGADIHLVPQALDGHLPEGAYGVLEVEEQEKEGRRERIYKFQEPPTLEKGMKNLFVGIALIAIFALAFFHFAGRFWLWIWLLIPALECVGEGIGQIIRSRREPAALPNAATFRAENVLRAARPQELPAADTNEIAMPPASVTESTTRHLGVPAAEHQRERT